MSSLLENSGIAIRPADTRDVHKLIPLLPQGIASPVNTRYLIAEQRESGDLLGGAYYRVTPTANGTRVASLGFATPSRTGSEETASQLLGACLHAASMSGARRIFFDRMVPANSSDEQTLKRHGFAPMQTLIEYEMDCRAALDACNRVYDRLKAKGKIPGEASVFALDDAPITPVDALVKRCLGGSLAALDKSIMPKISTVARFETKIIGAIIVVNPARPEVPYTVIDKSHRATWAAPMMWRRGFAEGLRQGYKSVYFSTNGDQFTSFSNFARHIGSKEVSHRLRYGRAL